MAGITKIDGKSGVRWKADVRRVGYPTQVQYFHRKADAEKWRRSVIVEMEAGKFRDDSLARKHTVGELIDRYIVEVIPLKRAGKVQVHQLAEWKMVLGHLRLSQLTPDQILNARSKIAERAEPGKVRSHSTLNRYQAALSHALSYAK